MYYEINVALAGEHFFATHKRSINSLEKMNRVYSALKKAFPGKDGYSISVTRWEKKGTDIPL